MHAFDTFVHIHTKEPAIQWKEWMLYAAKD